MRSIKVKDYMTDYVLSFSPQTELYKAIEGLRQRHASSAPVLDKEGRLVGMVSQWDCLRGLVHGSYFDELGGQVSEFMRTELLSASPADDIVDIAEAMVAQQWHAAIPVVEGQQLVGILSCSDILKMVHEFEQGKKTA